MHLFYIHVYTHFACIRTGLMQQIRTTFGDYLALCFLCVFLTSVVISSLFLGSPECTDCLTGTFAVLSPLLVLVKGLLVQTFRDSSLHTLKDKIHNCLQYALRVYPLSLKSLSPLYHFHQCVASGEVSHLWCCVRCSSPRLLPVAKTPHWTG